MIRLMLKKLFQKHPQSKLMALDFIKYIGPGLLVTIGFIDPGNWATNVAAGADYGYSLLWVISLGTLMLIILQHNSAHLGIVTGYCLSEAATFYLKPWLSKTILSSAMLAASATALAEILGGAIALEMIFGLSVKIGAVLITVLVCWMLFSNSYQKLEKWIIGFVSLIGLSFIFELSLVHIEWSKALESWVIPNFPKNSLLIIISVLGAVVMPHNLFLHSEIIQSRQCNIREESHKIKLLKYEFLDTSFSMLVGWAINSAIVLLAATTFFAQKTSVTDLTQAELMLRPLLGNAAAVVFAFALLLAGISALVTAGMAGGTIFPGIFGEPYDIHDSHTKTGVLLTLLPALIIIFVINNPFKGLIYSQMFLGVQLPITIFGQIYLTSSKKLMGKFVNSALDKIMLWGIGLVVTGLNILFFVSLFK